MVLEYEQLESLKSLRTTTLYLTTVCKESSIIRSVMTQSACIVLFRIFFQGWEKETTFLRHSRETELTRKPVVCDLNKTVNPR